MSPSAFDLRKAGLAAHACLLLESAHLYGFIEGGFTINVERCEEVIELAAGEGYEYTDEEIHEAALAMVAAHNEEVAS